MKFNWSQTLRTAEKHLSRGKTAAAIEEYRKLVNWDPTDLSTLNALGDLYVRAGLNEEATRIFSRVAQGYRHQGFTSKAIAVLKKLLRIDPADLDSAAGLAACYLAQGLRGEASRHYADVAAAYRRAGREDKALDAYQRMAEIDPSNTSLLMTLGERWLSEGLKQRAHASFAAAGVEYSRQGDDERALTAYLKAQTVQPDEHKTLEAIASICAARGQADSAIPILCESLSRNSGDAELHRILGSTYLSAGRLEDAERTFQKLLALDVGEYRNLLVVGEKFLDNGDLDRAVEQIDGIVDWLIAHQNEQEAVDFLRKVLDRDPEHPASLRRLALIYRRLREDFTLAPTLKALADGALRRGDREEAIEALTELCSLDPHERAHRDALQSIGVDAPASPFAVCSATDNSWEYATSDGGGQCNVLPAAADASRCGYTDDAMALLESAPENGADNLEIRFALKKIYASEGSLDLADNECLQIGGMSHESRRPAVALHDFVPAGEINGASPFSQHDTSSPANPSGTVTDFEVVTGGDRRRTARVPARVPLVVKSDTGGWREFTETIDVSEAGLRLQLAHPMPPMTVLRVSLDMAKWPGTVERPWSMSATKGIVCYCRRWPGQPSLVGVELRPNPHQLPAAEQLPDGSSDSM